MSQPKTKLKNSILLNNTTNLVSNPLKSTNLISEPYFHSAIESLAQDESLHPVRTKLKSISHLIDALLESLVADQSHISSAVLIWHRWNWLDKIMVGGIVSGPLISIGVVANVAALSAIGVVILFIYILSGYLLSNHYRCEKNKINALKMEVRSLTHLLGFIIEEFNDIHEQLKVDANLIKAENKLLSENNRLFAQQINLLKLEIVELIKIKTTFERISTELKETKETLEESTNKLQVSTKKYEELEQKLLANVTELEKIKNLLAIEYKNQERISNSFKQLINEWKEIFSKSHIPQSQLDAYFEKNQQIFDIISGHLSTVINDLKAQLALAIEQSLEYKKLLEEHRVLIAEQRAANKQGWFNYFFSCFSRFSFFNTTPKPLNNSLSSQLPEPISTP